MLKSEMEMTSSDPKAISLETEIAKALNLQSQIDRHISQGNEAEIDKLSREYETVIKVIFALHKGDSDHILAKVDFSRDLLLAEHPMPTLVDAVFASLREDLHLVFSDKVEAKTGD